MMLHVLAQMSVAVTSRAMLVAFDRLGVDAAAGYVVALWLPVVASALVAEVCALRRIRNEEVVAARVPALVAVLR
jgi:hypothetical protein